MSSKSALVIGASRGIGLGLAKELAGRGYRVVASRRSPSEALDQAAADSGGSIEPVQADVTDPASIAALARKTAPGSLDILVLNAGVYGPGEQSLRDLTRESVADIVMTNAVGPVQAALDLLPLLKDGGTVGMMSSKMGSIADSSGGANHYRLSKVAQNMLAHSLFENHAKPRAISVLSLHPGWVRTDMGGPNALIGVEESVAGMADLLEANGEPRHVFRDYAGKDLPW